MPVHDELTPEFVELVGRIVLTATEVEHALADMCATLDADGTEDMVELWARHGGSYGSTLLTYLESNATDSLDPRVWREEFATFVDDARQALGERNEVVHSRWLAIPEHDLLHAGRYLLPHLRPANGPPWVSRYWTLGQLRQLLALLRGIDHACPIWAGRIETSIRRAP